ncbi:MAG: DNA polymerase III subunit gamma/tau [Actinobacteria bacterium]|nr:DNA polymerase III subunit gamma/tau [Actinomycetota bacterium]
MTAAASSNHGSLYRRHRPRTFDDVIGQEHVVRTLRNAIDQNSVHHAYMFVGSRGTGKTSMAKILASALNCTDGPRSDFAADDPAIDAIAAGTSMDVVEMDAASHNGVDDIRELIESVSVMPVAGGWKVYILDEAHMITPQGWNAFLKTLEEPPPHTVFILATTEANKVLPTVADRCHRFDFRRPTVEQLTQALRRAADAEAIEIGDDAVTMIARSATGSFRDALGTLEQLVTYGGSSVNSEDVQAVLGVADFEMLDRVAAAVADGDRRGVLTAVAELADSGRDMIAFARDFAAHIRNLLVARTLGEPPDSLGLTAEQATRLSERAESFGPERCAHTLELVSRMITAARAGGDPRLQLELALFKAARPEDDGAPDALLARIESLERRVTEAPTQQEGAAKQPSEPTATAEAAPVAPDPVPESVPASPASEPNPEPVRAEESPPPEIETTESEPAPAEPSPSATPTLDEMLAAWPSVLAAVHETSPRLGVALESARPHSIEGRRLTIAFAQSDAFLRKTADQSTGREVIAEQILNTAGFSVAVVTDLLPDDQFEPHSAEAAPGGIDGDELIERLKKEFDATEMADTAETGA